MEKRALGDTGIDVSRLCLGVLPVGPLQRNLPPSEGASIVREALEAGINFLDTAEMYQTYDHIKPALRGYSGDVVLASKSMAASYGEMRRAIEKALSEMDVEVIDIFHIHAAKEPPAVFQDRAKALECLVRAKEEGLIRAVGLATHSVASLKAAALRQDIDVIFPIVNIEGLGISDGSRDDMVNAISLAHSKGKGLYAMKALGGGNLSHRIVEAFSFVLQIDGLASVAVGMVSKEEIRINTDIFKGIPVPEKILQAAHNSKRLLIRSGDCTGCGACVEACPNDALDIRGDKASVDTERCILCGYCGPACEEFNIRVV